MRRRRAPPACGCADAGVVTAAGGAAALSITATGDASITYQWRCNGVTLLNTDKISGATTPSLAITDVRANNAGTYVCAATMACGTTLSAPATLTLTNQTGDFDGDGDVDLQDFGYLQGCLTGVSVPVTDPACFDARLDQDTDVDQDDLGYFRNCLSGPSIPATPACAGGAG